MSYMGNVELKASNIRRFDVTGSTSATHTLTWTAPNEQSMIVTINGVKQQNNYTVSGTTLTLDTPLITTDALEVIGINDVGTTITPAQGSVNADQLATDAVSTVKIADDAVTDAKLANSINTDIAANTAKVTNATHTGDVTGATALTIAADAVTTAKIVDDAVTAAKLADGAYLANRNFIDNGAMQVSQRQTTATLATGDYVLDRWLPYEDSMGTAVFTLSQSSTSPDGFANSLRVECTTLDASVDAAATLTIKYSVEGQDLQCLKKGTASALDVTFSFWVRSFLTGTYILEVRDRTNNRIISKSYTVNVADTWEYKTITFDGDTTGALADDNGKGLEMSWWLVAGTDWSSGTLATSWESKVNANRAVGQVNFGSSTSNNFYLTGVQMEIGSTATTYENKLYGRELEACQRYFRLIGRGMIGMSITTTAFDFYGLWAEMRTSPSASLNTTTPSAQMNNYGVIYGTGSTVAQNLADKQGTFGTRIDGFTLTAHRQSTFGTTCIEMDAEFAA